MDKPILEKQPSDIEQKEVNLNLISKEINYLFSKINWGSSFLDANAIQVMNTLIKHIKWGIENGKI